MDRRKKGLTSPSSATFATTRYRRPRLEMIQRETRRMFTHTRELQLTKAS